MTITQNYNNNMTGYRCVLTCMFIPYFIYSYSEDVDIGVSSVAQFLQTMVCLFY